MVWVFSLPVGEGVGRYAVTVVLRSFPHGVRLGYLPQAGTELQGYLKVNTAGS